MLVKSPTFVVASSGLEYCFYNLMHQLATLQPLSFCFLRHIDTYIANFEDRRTKFDNNDHFCPEKVDNIFYDCKFFNVLFVEVSGYQKHQIIT